MTDPAPEVAPTERNIDPPLPLVPPSTEAPRLPPTETAPTTEPSDNAVIIAAPATPVTSDTRPAAPATITLDACPKPLSIQEVPLDEAGRFRAERLILEARNERGIPESAPARSPASLIAHGRIRVQEPDLGDLTEAWVIGDIHADLPGLAWTIEALRPPDRSKGPRTLFLLGDLIDDLPESAATIRLVHQLSHDPDFRTIVLVGNHDEALQIDDAGRFRADISPADFKDEICAETTDPTIEGKRALAKNFCDWVRTLPVAIFLRDGTIIAHGGVPHRDLLDRIKTPQDLSRPEALSDFIWARLVPEVKRRMAVAQTVTRSRELGSEDFKQFCHHTSQVLGLPLRRMIRGHDHEATRYAVHGHTWEDRVVTINNMSRRLPREFLDAEWMHPHVVRWRPDQPLQPMRIVIDPEWRRRQDLEQASESQV
jgi:hypothetical protein